MQCEGFMTILLEITSLESFLQTVGIIFCVGENEGMKGWSFMFVGHSTLSSRGLTASSIKKWEFLWPELRDAGSISIFQLAMSQSVWASYDNEHHLHCPSLGRSFAGLSLVNLAHYWPLIGWPGPALSLAIRGPPGGHHQFLWLESNNQSHFIMLDSLCAQTMMPFFLAFIAVLQVLIFLLLRTKSIVYRSSNKETNGLLRILILASDRTT